MRCLGTYSSIIFTFDYRFTIIIPPKVKVIYILDMCLIRTFVLNSGRSKTAMRK